jgi:hypothetical protein
MDCVMIIFMDYTLQHPAWYGSLPHRDYLYLTQLQKDSAVSMNPRD